MIQIVFAVPWIKLAELNLKHLGSLSDLGGGIHANLAGYVLTALKT